MRVLNHDDRYTANLEWCGYPERRMVLRYCGEFLGSFRSLPQATLRAACHRAQMNGSPVIVERPVTVWGVTAARVQAALDSAEA